MISKIASGIDYIRNLTPTTVVFIFSVLAQGIEYATREMRKNIEGNETNFLEMQILLYVILTPIQALQILISKRLRVNLKEGKQKEAYHLVVSGTLMSLLLGIGVITGMVLRGLYFYNDFSYLFRKISIWPLSVEAKYKYQVQALTLLYAHMITKVFYRILLSALLGNGQAGYSLVLKGGGSLLRLAGALLTLYIYPEEMELGRDGHVEKGIFSSYGSIVQQIVMGVIFLYGVSRIFYQFNEEQIGTLREASLSTFTNNRLFSGGLFKEYLQYCLVKIYVTIAYLVDVFALKIYLIALKDTREYGAAIYTIVVGRISDMFTVAKLITLGDIEERISKGERASKVFAEVSTKIFAMGGAIGAALIAYNLISTNRKVDALLAIITIISAVLKGINFYLGAYARYLEKAYVNQIQTSTALILVVLLFGAGAAQVLTPKIVVYTVFLLHGATSIILFIVIYFNIDDKKIASRHTKSE